MSHLLRRGKERQFVSWRSRFSFKLASRIIGQNEDFKKNYIARLKLPKR